MLDPEQHVIEQLGRGGDQLAEALGFTLATLEGTGLLSKEQLESGRRSVVLWHNVHRMARDACEGL